jgi:hypothetical protein
MSALIGRSPRMPLGPMPSRKKLRCWDCEEAQRSAIAKKGL